MIIGGISEQQMKILKEIFSRFPALQKVNLYGSRAKGNFHERSDIDLAAFGPELNRFMIEEILMELDESDIPFLVDLQDYQQIQNNDLREHIDRVGVVIYQKE